MGAVLQLRLVYSRSTVGIQSVLYSRNLQLTFSVSDVQGGRRHGVNPHRTLSGRAVFVCVCVCVYSRVGVSCVGRLIIQIKICHEIRCLILAHLLLSSLQNAPR